MSAKILLPLSALVACPLTLIAFDSKNPEPDEATQPLEKTSQQASARTVIDAARLSATVRPDSPQPLIERSNQSSPSDSPISPSQATLSPVAPLINLSQFGGASLEEIIARSLVKPLETGTAPSTGSSPLLPQTSETAVAPEPITTNPDPLLRAADIAVPQSTAQSLALSLSIHSASTQSSFNTPTDSNSPADRGADRAIQLIPDINSWIQDHSYSSTVLDDITPAVPSGQSTDSALPIKPDQGDSLAPQSKATPQKAHLFASLLPTETPIDSPRPSAGAGRSARIATPVSFSRTTPVRQTASARATYARATYAQATPAQAAPAQATPAQATPTQTATPQLTIIGETYTLGAGDRVNINFFNVPEYSGEYQVAADGSVNLPVVGGASLTGLTLQEAGSFIASLYQSELAHPRVTVNLVTRRPLQVSIIGEVGQPGLYTISADQSAQVIQAIQTAGGFTQSANLRQVQIRRSFRGLNQTIGVDVWSLLENGDLSQNLILQDGDSLYVPAAEAIDLANSGRLASSNLATATDTQLKIALVGEVNRPGAYQLPSTSEARATLTQAIQTAGGITPTADVRRVQIRRTTRMGDTQTIDVNLWQLLQSGDLNQDLILQDGDTIVLAKAEQLPPAEALQLASTNLSPSAIQVNLMGEVKTPGSLQLPSNITLNQAIQQAGGLNSRARRSVQLIRMSPTGTLSRRTIGLDFDQDANTELNPVLQNNDLVIVGRSTATQVADGVSNVLEPFLRIFTPLQGLFGF
jgi:polysaccharide biosynthesis/export protein